MKLFLDTRKFKALCMCPDILNGLLLSEVFSKTIATVDNSFQYVIYFISLRSLGYIQGLQKRCPRFQLCMSVTIDDSSRWYVMA